MKKGFTLIELLATITLLGLLIAVTYPKILEVIERKQVQIDDETLNLISNAANQYMKQNINEYPREIGTTYCFSIQELDEENLIPVDVKKYEEQNLTIKIGKNNQDIYEVVETCPGDFPN